MRKPKGRPHHFSKIGSFLSCDILFLQEHWLSDDHLKLLGGIAHKFLYTAVSGFSNADVLAGRPYGGCAILWRSGMSVTVNVININSRRMSCSYV